jgi:oligopeptide/dipeptide ABC transporter ATP-binding protein
MRAENILELKNLSAGYGPECAVADVTLSLRRGEILCVVGESGCGKSTLLKAVQGMEPRLRILEGRVVLDGKELQSLPEKERRKECAERIGMVLQNPGGAFNPIRSYRKQFIETLRSRGAYEPAAFEDRAAEALKKLGLEDCRRILASCPYELSGGMNQRVALALTLLLGQEVLLADEPTSALDATVQLQVAKEFLRLGEVSGVSQIVVTHNLALAGFLGDRIAVMYAGRLAELGPAKAVTASPRHPYTRGLLAAIPTLAGRMPAPLPGQPPPGGPVKTGCAFAPRCPRALAECRSAPYALREASPGHFTACLREKGDGK